MDLSIAFDWLIKPTTFTITIKQTISDDGKVVMQTQNIIVPAYLQIRKNTLLADVDGRTLSTEYSVYCRLTPRAKAISENDKLVWEGETYVITEKLPRFEGQYIKMICKKSNN